jgi:hypothetical protein
MVKSNLLFDEPPLVVIPSLAVAVGLEEAIVLQQLHYWLLRSTNERDGRTWVYNTLAEWTEQFPFWSTQTIRRVLNSLREKEVVITANYNQMKIDRTLWYTIDYEKLNSICRNQQMDSTDSTDACDQNQQTNNQRLPEITTENKPLRANTYRNSSFVSADGYTQEAVKAGVDVPTFVAIFNLLIDAAGWRALVDTGDDTKLNYAKQEALTLIKMGTNDTEKVATLITTWKVANEWRNAPPKPRDLAEYASQLLAGVSSSVNGAIQKGRDEGKTVSGRVAGFKLSSMMEN